QPLAGSVQATMPESLLDVVVPLVTECAINRSVCQRLSAAASFEAAASGQFKMVSGSLLLSPHDQAIQLITPQGVIEIAAGSKALVQVKHDFVAIFNLHDTRLGQVKLTAGKSIIEVGIGKAIVVGANDGDNFSNINPAPEVAIRDLKSQVNANGQRIFSA